MRKPTFLLALAVVVAAAAPVGAADSRIGNPRTELKPVREIMVPFEDLHVLLEEKTQRVLLTRKEYEDLLARARRGAEARAPQGAVLSSAEYSVQVADERALITGTLTVDVLDEGLHAIGLEVGNVGLRSATLDGKGAPIGLADDGRLMLFVEGAGRHSLVLQMVAALQTTAARQILDF